MIRKLLDFAAGELRDRLKSTWDFRYVNVSSLVSAQRTQRNHRGWRRLGIGGRRAGYAERSPFKSEPRNEASLLLPGIEARLSDQ